MGGRTYRHVNRGVISLKICFSLYLAQTQLQRRYLQQSTLWYFSQPTSSSMDIYLIRSKTHTKHILYFIPTISLQVAHPLTLTHAGLPPFILQKSTTPIIPYQIMSFNIHNFHNKQSHPIFYQHLSLIVLTHTQTHTPETYF